LIRSIRFVTYRNPPGAGAAVESLWAKDAHGAPSSAAFVDSLEMGQYGVTARRGELVKLYPWPQIAEVLLEGAAKGAKK
jgi:hypothetical protein